MSGAGLKWLAMATMLIDHIAAVVLAPAWGVTVDFTHLSTTLEALAMGGHVAIYTAMRLIGRLAFPIFCFLLAEGLVHTHSRPRYLRNLLVLAVASEVPFDLGVVMTVDDVANIVHEACDARDLHIMLAVIEIFQDLASDRGHMRHVGKAVFRKAHAHQCAVGFFDVNADRRIVFDVFKSDLQSNQLLFF